MQREKLEYHRTYNAERYYRVRTWMRGELGNKCVQCGSLDRLEIDHIVAEKKAFPISEMWAYKKDKLESELKKCQLLCEDCHRKKTISDLGNNPAIGTHGTLSASRYCHCAKCRSSKSAYMREWKRKRRADKLQATPL
jgi:5-methylcytosine-specific restriction endonuclease McrA